MKYTFKANIIIGSKKDQWAGIIMKTFSNQYYISCLIIIFLSSGKMGLCNNSRHYLQVTTKSFKFLGKSKKPFIVLCIRMSIACFSITPQSNKNINLYCTCSIFEFCKVIIYYFVKWGINLIEFLSYALLKIQVVSSKYF